MKKKQPTKQMGKTHYRFLTVKRNLVFFFFFCRIHFFFLMQSKDAAFPPLTSSSSFPWHKFAHWNVIWTKSQLSGVLPMFLFNPRHRDISRQVCLPTSNNKSLQGCTYLPTIISWYSAKENVIQTSVESLENMGSFCILQLFAQDQVGHKSIQ